jgi:hypothetical protein
VAPTCKPRRRSKHCAAPGATSGLLRQQRPAAAKNDCSASVTEQRTLGHNECSASAPRPLRISPPSCAVPPPRRSLPTFTPRPGPARQKRAPRSARAERGPSGRAPWSSESPQVRARHGTGVTMRPADAAAARPARLRIRATPARSGSMNPDRHVRPGRYGPVPFRCVRVRSGPAGCWLWPDVVRRCGPQSDRTEPGGTDPGREARTWAGRTGPSRLHASLQCILQLAWSGTPGRAS